MEADSSFPPSSEHSINTVVDCLSMRHISCAETDVQETHLQSISRTEISTEAGHWNLEYLQIFFPLFILVALREKKDKKKTI